MELGIVYYFYNINEIGGIETFFYQLAKKYHDRDITIIYRIGNLKQIDRLKKYVKVIQYHEEVIRCKQAFFNFNLDIIDKVISEEYILVIHGDYKDMIEKNQITAPPRHPKITKVVAVSNLAAKNYTEITGIPCETCYNPFEIPKYDRPLLLMSATRLSVEKGFERMKKLALELEEQDINYLWFVFTNSPQQYISDNMIYLSSRLDIDKYMKGFDYVIQLSDNEGYCYTLIEALSQNIPVVCTPCPVFKELNINESNSITLEFDCSNIKDVVKKIKENNFNFNYKPKKDNWNKLLLNIKSNYYKDFHVKVEVKATDLYHINNISDAELKMIPKQNQTWYTSKNRAKFLQERGYVKIIKEEKNENNSNNTCI